MRDGIVDIRDFRFNLNSAIFAGKFQVTMVTDEGISFYNCAWWLEIFTTEEMRSLSGKAFMAWSVALAMDILKARIFSFQ